jgi:hypothetical protein
MQLSRDELRAIIRWSTDYDPGWDNVPDRYADRGIVKWGKSRRLGLLLTGRCKAYLGVQHVDPSKPGWGIHQEPQTRFFASMFLDGSCAALRTFQTMDETLDGVLAFVGAFTKG